MAVIFKQVGGTAIFSADAEVRTKDGILEVSFVETQRTPKGDMNGVLQINENSEGLALVFGKLKKELDAFKYKKTATLRLPCFLRLPLCRITETQYIIACRLRGRPAIECLREGEAIYRNCKGNC
ncbi:hypothetical protein PAECIP111891_00161 [Paenibacillus allorhizoplanae]|uniref:Uncharacterized protein n=1 Tax=Paenibacillus allorhizoplanae TaxID=2905648 RepID=A0ABN8FTC7_9BACL|nr:hypothetical protein [Paenibacillus allorhizoplanae]CAH1191980.1 hypothetical protein PAECIP111891_00161 [Paenibacillus allorhizoplanae]